MKKVVFFALIAALALGSCKSSKKAATSPYTPASQETTTTTAPPKVFTVPDPKPAATTPVVEEKPVTMREEAITFTQPEDRNQNSFFIIIGSFSSMDNAKNFRQTLISEGFTPIIVQSETGYYRVTVDSFTGEAAARERLLQIRRDYPKYGDTWLLIKK